MKRENITSLLLFICLFFLGQPAFAAESNPLQMILISEEETIQPGRPFWVALHLKMGEHWHSYWKNPGDAGMPTSISWELPSGLTASSIEWPYPQRFDLDSLIGYGYEGEAWLLTEITPPAKISDPVLTLKAHVRALVCSDTSCLPAESELVLQMPVSQKEPLPRIEWVAAFEQARAKLPKSKWSVRAERAGDLIRLTVAAPSDASPSQNFQEVHFFPEKGSEIDARSPLTFEAVSANQYTVVLKSDAASLKGVLLLAHPEGNEVIAVDTALEQNGEIAVADEIHVEAAAPHHEESFGVALVLAFIGGMLLNLMPCVLPVISFKILSFVKMAGQSRSKTLQHGLAFAAGVIVSFWVLAGMILLLQAYGHSVGWGFQLQEPLFIALLAALLLVFGLSLFGVFEMGTSVMGMASDAQQRVSGLVGSFFSGVLATAVATPCTGPFLGTAVGFAVTLPALLALAVFTSVGAGMAAPYLALTAFPSLLRYMPKPGAWMVTFKELMGFLMVGTVLWLTWVFGAQTGNLGLFLMMSSLFLIAIACWIYGKWGNALKPRVVRLPALFAAILCIIGAGYVMIEASHPESIHSEVAMQEASSDWEPYSAERIAELQSQGTPVFVDFTAKWCLICQANHLVLSVNEVKTAFDQAGVVRMKADWTRGDPAITEALKKHGRNSVPLYLMYGADPAQAPQILPQVLTPEIVLNELRPHLAQ